MRDEDLLPSFLYLPGAADFPAGTLALPWDADRDFVVGPPGAEARRRERRPAGVLGQDRGSRIPAWTAPRRCCPSARPKASTKISPVEASRRYLEHLREAWDAKMPDAPFAEQQVLVTVPASFDAVARELTLEAAEQAGYRERHAARRAAGRVLRVDRAAPGLARARAAWAT